MRRIVARDHVAFPCCQKRFRLRLAKQVVRFFCLPPWAPVIPFACLALFFREIFPETLNKPFMSREPRCCQNRGTCRVALLRALYPTFSLRERVWERSASRLHVVAVSGARQMPCPYRCGTHVSYLPHCMGYTDQRRVTPTGLAVACVCLIPFLDRAIS